MSKLNDDELATVRTMINEHESGVTANAHAWSLTQKPLTYGELVELRKILRERSMNRSAETGRQAANRALKFADDYSIKAFLGLSETFLPPRPKTSTLLSDAANMISDAVRELNVITFTPIQALLMGKDWTKLCDQLRERAKAFKTIEDTP